MLITGEDRFLGYSLMCGAQAALIGMGAACTALQAELLQSFLSGQADRFLTPEPRGRRPGPAHVPGPDGRLHPAHALVSGSPGCLAPSAAHDPWGPRLDASEFDVARRVPETPRSTEPGEASRSRGHDRQSGLIFCPESPDVTAGL